MTRTRRFAAIAAIAAGLAFAAAASAGAGAARADTAPVTTLRTGYILCAGVDGVAGACVEDPFTTIGDLPQPRQVVHDLTGVG